MEEETANSMAKLLQRILIGETSTEDDKEWDDFKVSEPIVNNIIIVTRSGKQYNIQVKPVSR